MSTLAIEPTKSVALPETMTVKKLAELLHVPVSNVIMELMQNKIIATINEEIDFDTASIIANDLGFQTTTDTTEKTGSLTLVDLANLVAAEKTEADRKLVPRPPIVTILGHVDHGKTTLLDSIRKANVAAGEAGGITQKISAYQVKKHGQLITFIDTPGHEAFSGMRERGVSIADIAILVVAADDGVRPQTKEVIQFINEKKLPVIVAINKIDKPDAKPDRVKQELAENGLLFEGWGGDVMCVEVSAKGNINIDKLLDAILLVAEVEEFTADEKRDGLAVILESHLDPQKGPVATVLIKTGTLKVGQDIIAGSAFGRVRRLEDFTGKNRDAAGPSVPAILYGFSEVPQVNDVVQVVSGKSLARMKSQEALLKEGEVKKVIRKEDENVKRFPIIIKADVQGSLEAIQQILGAIEHPEVALDEVAAGVGSITESDVKLAASSGAKIFGFNAEPTSVAKRIAETSGVAIQSFSIIYKLVETVRNDLAALLPPEIVRTDFGQLSILAVFKSGKRDMIVGGRVAEGKIIRGSLLEVKRDGEIVGSGKMGNLQQNKKNAEEVGQGNECGLVFDGTVKLAVGDTLISYQVEEKRRSL